jgi:addiction module RelE/StbE family toxin
MINLLWTKSARADRREIFEFIAKDSIRAAGKIDRLFENKAGILIRFPELGHPGRISGTREFLAHKHYFLIYRIYVNMVQILRVLHTSRQWPPSAN